MKTDEKLIGIRAKVERANNHLSDLDAASRAFCDTQEDQIRSSVNPNTGERTYYGPPDRDVPVEIAIIAGDAVHNLRSALDHLAYQLVLANGNNPTRNTYFPICDDASDYPKNCVERTKGMSQKAITRIGEAKPYKGGNDTLWRLHKLDIIDKHRLLFTTCVLNPSHSITPSQVAGASRTFPGKLSVPHDLQIASPIRSVPLKAGVELLTVPRSDAGAPIKFRFIIAFNEPEIFTEPISIMALQPMASFIDDFTASFKPLLV